MMKAKFTDEDLKTKTLELETNKDFFHNKENAIHKFPFLFSPHFNFVFILCNSYRFVCFNRIENLQFKQFFSMNLYA